ncbi:MAG: family lipase [Adhaeribacter sp.]|nr:family lipase [Adhaeribacter sp.]
MRKIKVSTTLGYILFLFTTLFYQYALAQNTVQGTSQASAATYDLKNGDRVVFLGNSLFENDLQYGYLELALTTRWAHRDVTFRNIGWSGDTVWGEARSYISSPSAYDLLIEQLTKAQPTVVFIAYGAIEALEGEAGLPRFNQGLTKLLDKIDQLGAKAILLSPVPVMAGVPAEVIGKQNAMLELYAAAIAKTASSRNIRYIDIFNPLLARSKEVKLSDNGIHLNETGYYYLASTIEKGLGLAPGNAPVVINASKNVADAPVKILDAGQLKGNLKFKIETNYLPLPLPQQAGETTDKGQVIQITGLKKGYYSLTADGSPVITASAKKWKEGVEIRQGAAFSQASQLRELILKKNEMFFHQYRPQNRTYILGFRSHEQGRHAKGLEDLNIIITWLEGQIALNRQPKSPIYQLTPVK